MFISDTTTVGAQVMLLAHRGLRRAAEGLIDVAREKGWLDHNNATTLHTRIQEFQPADIPHLEVHGIFLDSIVTSLHFEPQTDRGLAREAFRQAVRWIEIETSSRCNRRCSYCPNSLYDRLSSNEFLDMEVYRRTLTELAEIGYDGEIKFVGNNEFFLYRENRAYVEMARIMLPRARLTLFSNGDAVKRHDLEWANATGVSMLIVTLHPGPTQPYDDAEALRRAWVFQQQTGFALQLRHYQPGMGLHWWLRMGSMTVMVGTGDLASTGHNWAGVLPGHDDFTRIDACTYPLRQFTMTHQGDTLACCIMFKGRTPENAASGALTGNVAEAGSIFLAYAGDAQTRWRRALFKLGVKEGPCRTCTGHADYVEHTVGPLAEYISCRI